MSSLIPRRSFTYAALAICSVALAGAGYSVSARTKIPASLRPAPAATAIVGTTTGPLLYVQNNGTTPYDTYGVLGVAGVGPVSIGVLGYGANNAQPNLALTGYDIGPGSVASVGYAAYPEPGTGPGSTATTGVYGIAPDGVGVRGQTSVQHGSAFGGGESTYAGVIGLDATTNGGFNSGVVGVTTNGLFGVEGISGSGGGGGVFGLATTGDGVLGLSSTGTGVSAESNMGAGLVALSIAQDGIDATSDGTFTSGVHGEGYMGLEGQSASTSDFPLSLENHVGSVVGFVDDSGDLFLDGSVTTILATRGGAVGKAFASQSTMRTLEDFGTGTLVNGTGSVRLDPAFAQMIDGGGYEVFLTPEGDNRGLYVAQKTATAFVVRESQGGRSSLAFDYRIVGRQYAHANERTSIARTASAFGGPKPSNVAPDVSRGALRLKAALASKAFAGRNPYATPSIISGLALQLGH